MKKLLLCVLVFVFVLAANAQATIILDWTITPNAATADPSVGGGSLDLIVGKLTADLGVINAIDAGKIDEPGFTGQFYQDWSTVSPTTEMPAPTVDTHFLTDSVDMLTLPLPEFGPGEDGSSPFGFGTHFYGVFGLFPSGQAETIDFVQFYVPAGTTVEYYLEVSESDQDKEVFWSEFQDTVGVPEPGVLCLLGVGALSMLLIRRR